jgi:farnesyl-diphosphate farnesyltransferase
MFSSAACSVFQCPIMQELLRQVSRSFYLTLRILPHSIKAPLSLAYLLARAADTIADTRLVDVGQRRGVLLQLRRSIQEACEGRIPPLPDFGEFAAAQKGSAGEGTAAERVLLENLGKLLETLRTFSVNDRIAIRAVLETITNGQEMDLMRFGTASADQIAALDTDKDLDEYTYKVAGCVGEFWTQICRAHVFPKARLNDEALFANAVRFGKGLQLVNILRDLPKDLRQGRCYIPRLQLSDVGLRPEDLLDANMIERFRPLYSKYLDQAIGHLFAGWQYTTALPFRYVRLRLACAWPILIGVQTVGRLRQDNILNDQFHIRISRSDTWRLILRSVILYPNPAAWNSLLEKVNHRAFLRSSCFAKKR